MIKISPTSKQYVNPMDLNLDYSDDDNPLLKEMELEELIGTILENGIEEHGFYE